MEVLGLLCLSLNYTHNTNKNWHLREAMPVNAGNGLNTGTAALTNDTTNSVLPNMLPEMPLYVGSLDSLLLRVIYKNGEAKNPLPFLFSKDYG